MLQNMPMIYFDFPTLIADSPNRSRRTASMAASPFSSASIAFREPQVAKMNAAYFAQEIVMPLPQDCDGQPKGKYV
jgi:exopolysaccharide biosynthesis protein